MENIQMEKNYYLIKLVKKKKKNTHTHTYIQAIAKAQA